MSSEETTSKIEVVEQPTKPNKFNMTSIMSVVDSVILPIHQKRGPKKQKPVSKSKKTHEEWKEYQRKYHSEYRKTKEQMEYQRNYQRIAYYCRKYNKEHNTKLTVKQYIEILPKKQPNSTPTP